MAEGFIKGFVATVLRVPPKPEPPMGSPGSVRVFNAAPGFYRYRVAQWALGQLGTATGLLVSLVVLNRLEVAAASWYVVLIGPLEVLGVLLFLAQLPFTFIMVDLDFRYRWYMITDTSLRIREGLLVVRERTMTFANIQNLSLRQGPLQRLLGIADLRVRTAGGGGGEGSGSQQNEISEAANMHLGFFRGVDNAENIRDAIIERMRALRDSGLGNPDEPTHPSPGGEIHDVIAAARDLVAETKLLRTALTR